MSAEPRGFPRDLKVYAWSHRDNAYFVGKITSTPSPTGPDSLYSVECDQKKIWNDSIHQMVWVELGTLETKAIYEKNITLTEPATRQASFAV